jgi:nickel-dependent lactate racemase
MRISIPYGRHTLDCEVDPDRLLPPALADPASAVRAALEAPEGYPPLHRILTPDDHVAILVDEALPELALLLTPVLEVIVSAGVNPEAITLLCPPSTSNQPWLDDLPEQFEETRLEVHDPADRNHLSYLATTKHGRRIYLNRTAVDADQLVLLTARRYDPHLGISGCEGALYPAVSDLATLQESDGRLSLDAPGQEVWPARREAAEVAWLLGAPFAVQVIESEGDGIARVLAGPVDASALGQRELDARWRLSVSARAETVVASVSGDPPRHRFADLAAALASAYRAVEPGGSIVLLTEANPPLGPGVELLRQADTPREALDALAHHQPPDRAAAFLWATAAQEASLYVLSAMPSETVEELFATPLDDDRQVQRLLRGQGPFLLIPDAHKAMVEVLPTPARGRKKAPHPA